MNLDLYHCTFALTPAKTPHISIARKTTPKQNTVTVYPVLSVERAPPSLLYDSLESAFDGKYTPDELACDLANYFNIHVERVVYINTFDHRDDIYHPCFLLYFAFCK